MSTHFALKNSKVIVKREKKRKLEMKRRGWKNRINLRKLEKNGGENLKKIRGNKMRQLKLSRINQRNAEKINARSWSKRDRNLNVRIENILN